MKNSQEESRARTKAPEPNRLAGAKKIARNGALKPGENGALKGWRSGRRTANGKRPIWPKRERVAAAGGQLFGAAFGFLSELLPQPPAMPETDQFQNVVKQQLSQCMKTGADGKLQFTVTFPDSSALDNMSKAIAALMAAGQGSGPAA